MDIVKGNLNYDRLFENAKPVYQVFHVLAISPGITKCELRFVEGKISETIAIVVMPLMIPNTRLWQVMASFRPDVIVWDTAADVPPFLSDSPFWVEAQRMAVFTPGLV